MNLIKPNLAASLADVSIKARLTPRTLFNKGTYVKATHGPLDGYQFIQLKSGRIKNERL